MAALPAQAHAITVRAERGVRDALHARPVEADKTVNTTRPLSARQQVTRPAQIPLAFFADRPYKKDRPFRLDAAGAKRIEQRDERHKPAAVVGDAGRKQ